MHSHEEFITLLNGCMEQMIKAFLVGDEDKFKEHQALYETTARGQDDKLCMQCGPCYDHISNSRILQGLSDRTMSKEEAKRQLQAWQYAKNADMALASIANPSGPMVMMRSEFSTELPIVYLDQNVISNALATGGEQLLHGLLKLKNEGKVQYVYSPSHIEEVCKIPITEVKDRHLKALTQLTDNATLQPSGSGKIELFTEEPIYPLQRVAATPGATVAAEHNKVLKDGDRELYFPHYETEEHRKSIANNENIFESMPVGEFRQLIGLPTFYAEKEGYKQLTSHNEILNAIYSLHNALDCLSYKREKKEKQIKSSVHDVEHLIYASQCQFFVTEDERLVHRAKQIFRFMEFDVEILTTKEFLAKWPGGS